MSEDSKVADQLSLLESINSKLDQLLKWTRFAGLQQLRNVLAQTLTTDKELLAYELSDGERTTREIATLTDVRSNATIANYWRKWSRLGIVEPSQSRQGRFKHFCSLEEVGLTIPPTPGTETTTTDNEEEILDERQNQ
ncbi:MAG: hypothetical protein NWE95_11745 [Candidatus Bathyarchaeota archaeon]|nr:hypothetical protein [Candidatus Bathyarchaeota archaeon]